MGLVDSMRLGWRIGRSAWPRGRPFLLYLKPTARCDARCAICSRWKTRDSEPEMSLDEIRGTLEKFRRAGCVVLTLWGGEPLLRPDLPEILAHAKRLGYRTSMCTNCGRLARRADEVVGLLDVALCSLDGVGGTHDELRGVPGLFDRAVEGIRAASARPGTDVKIWASVHRRNLDQIEPLARLAAELGVGIEFFPVASIAGHNDDLVPRPDERARAFAQVVRLRRAGLPIRNPLRALRLLESGAPFRCNFPRIAVQVDPRGRVHSCEDPSGEPLEVWGDVASFDPRRAFGSPGFAAAARRLAACNRCRLPCVVELSGNLPRALAGTFLARARRGGS